ncbi:MAG: YigZ family protein [Bacteroidetes bacterium]|nr:YigZ family protein [Bacteroidota bacterium]MCW5897298.1 YigZ family protein [Bacteroidota bacterium]
MVNLLPYNMNDEYKTIAARIRYETKVRGSRFIASALPVSTKADTERFLAEIRKEFWDATHNCFAYKLGVDGSQFRFNDDGEPGGSAGKPILSSIEKHGLTDVLVVVTRYFGGTKLGVGGLVRAYGDAAEAVLTKAENVTTYILQTIEATFPHSHISNVMHAVSRMGARIVETAYDEDVHLTITIRRSKAEELKAVLVNHTSGNVALKSTG